MKILVIGVGGIGGFIGSYLVKNNYNVTFIAREKRLSYFVPSGRYWEEQERFDVAEIKALDALWLEAVHLNGTS